jgi:hypothetical protein
MSISVMLQYRGEQRPLEISFRDAEVETDGLLENEVVRRHVITLLHELVVASET